MKIMPRNPACWMCRGLEKENPLTIIELTHSVARLNRDQYFRGYSFVVFKEHETELYRLSEEERVGFYRDMLKVAQALDRVFKPDKMNYEVLGNKIPHLHWHLIPRYKSESFWGEPVWSNPHLERRLRYSEYQKIIGQIRAEISNQARL